MTFQTVLKKSFILCLLALGILPLVGCSADTLQIGIEPTPTLPPLPTIPPTSTPSVESDPIEVINPTSQPPTPTPLPTVDLLGLQH